MYSTVVLCHGVFDVLHAGHLTYLEKAKRYGDYLVVSVTADRFVNKGPGRPHFPAEKRAEMLRALRDVDEVIISDESTAVSVINKVKPQFYVKGPDYKDMESDPTGQIFAESAAVRAHGGQLIFTDGETHSSSALINKFLAPWTREQTQVIERIRELGGLPFIQSIFEIIKHDVKAAVVGELIWDTYRFVRPEGLSSKSPSISARFDYEEKYMGGAWAIVNHIKDFCPVNQISSGVEHEKIRYISAETSQRLFEVTHLPAEGDLSKATWPEHNLLIAADFGHGLLTRTNVRSDEFRALNVQTNSSNFGFNVFSKHDVFDYLVLDLRELRLAYNDRTSTSVDLGFRAHRDYGVPVGLTLGPDGSAFFSDGAAYTCPAFTDTVVDATGAGDAFLAITALLIKVEAPPELVGFLGNVFAGLKTKIIGNKASVSKASLLKACESILK